MELHTLRNRVETQNLEIVHLSGTLMDVCKQLEIAKSTIDMLNKEVARKGVSIGDRDRSIQKLESKIGEMRKDLAEKDKGISKIVTQQDTERPQNSQDAEHWEMAYLAMVRNNELLQSELKDMRASAKAVQAAVMRLNAEHATVYRKYYKQAQDTLQAPHLARHQRQLELIEDRLDEHADAIQNLMNKM